MWPDLLCRIRYKLFNLNVVIAGPLWYPGGGMTTSKVVHLIAVLFLHLIPAYLLDGLIYMTGNKPFLVRVQNKVAAGLDLLQYYTTKQWIFK